jgi:hypothetical protein
MTLGRSYPKHGKTMRKVNGLLAQLIAQKLLTIHRRVYKTVERSMNVGCGNRFSRNQEDAHHDENIRNALAVGYRLGNRRQQFGDG